MYIYKSIHISACVCVCICVYTYVRFKCLIPYNVAKQTTTIPKFCNPRPQSQTSSAWSQISDLFDMRLLVCQNGLEDGIVITLGAIDGTLTENLVAVKGCVNFDLNCPQIDSAESWGSESSSSARSTAASSSPQRNHSMASRGPRRPDPAKGKNSPRTNQSHRNRRPPRETATSQAKPPRETNESVATPRGTQREAN